MRCQHDSAKSQSGDNPSSHRCVLLLQDRVHTWLADSNGILHFVPFPKESSQMSGQRTHKLQKDQARRPSRKPSGRHVVLRNELRIGTKRRMGTASRAQPGSGSSAPDELLEISQSRQEVQTEPLGTEGASSRVQGGTLLSCGFFAF